MNQAFLWNKIDIFGKHWQKMCVCVCEKERETNEIGTCILPSDLVKEENFLLKGGIYPS